MNREVGYPKLSLLVDGEWLSLSGRATIDVIDPATEQVLGALPLASIDDLDRALAAAARAFPLWRATPTHEKTAICLRAAQLLADRAESIALHLTLESGKPFAEALDEVRFGVMILQFFASQALSPLGTAIATTDFARHQVVLPEPVGPVASLTPWNYPVVVPARKIGAALAAGCSMVLKPAEETRPQLLPWLEHFMMPDCRPEC